MSGLGVMKEKLGRLTCRHWSRMRSRSTWYSSVREFAQRQGTEAQHCRWLREDVADDVTLEELADFASKTSKMVGALDPQARSLRRILGFGHV